MTDLEALRKLLSDSGDVPVVSVPRAWLHAALEAVGRPAAPTEPTLAPRYLKVTEAATMLGMSASWLYHHWSEVPGAKRIGDRSLRFDAEELERWAKRRAA